MAIDTDSRQSVLYDLCNTCDDRIVREVLMAITGAPSYWLGACGCPDRRWQWRSPTGDTPWELIG